MVHSEDGFEAQQLPIAWTSLLQAMSSASKVMPSLLQVFIVECDLGERAAGRIICFRLQDSNVP